MLLRTFDVRMGCLMFFLDDLSCSFFGCFGFGWVFLGPHPKKIEEMIESDYIICFRLKSPTRLPLFEVGGMIL